MRNTWLRMQPSTDAHAAATPARRPSASPSASRTTDVPIARTPGGPFVAYASADVAVLPSPYPAPAGACTHSATCRARASDRAGVRSSFEGESKLLLLVFCLFVQQDPNCLLQEMLMQVLNLTQDQINSLPHAEREQIYQLVRNSCGLRVN